MTQLIPTYDLFVEPLLRILAQNPDGMRAADAHDAAADYLQLTAEQRQETLSSGRQATYKNRAGWAHDRLKRAGLSDSPQRGHWRLTQCAKPPPTNYAQKRKQKRKIAPTDSSHWNWYQLHSLTIDAQQRCA